MLADPLLAWFDRHARELPWRRGAPRDPYRVWVSEIMLQQTRVETVLRYYEPFLKAFPDVASLARASEDELMKRWEGLGYYRRARLLHEGARVVVERHGGALPDDPEALAALPGFGPYTVGAVASLAFGRALPAVDGNVLRVASRILALEQDVASPAAKRIVERWAREHQPAARPGAFNEALMELGATVCTPTSPRCGACPLAEMCAARAQGRAEAFPIKRAKREATTVRIAVAIARRGDLVLLERREEGLLAGTWGLPYVEAPEGADARALLAERVAALVGAPVRVAAAPAKRARHAFTHRRWEIEAYDAMTAGTGGAWRKPADVALATAHRRVLE